VKTNDHEISIVHTLSLGVQNAQEASYIALLKRTIYIMWILKI